MQRYWSKINYLMKMFHVEHDEEDNMNAEITRNIEVSNDSPEAQLIYWKGIQRAYCHHNADADCLCDVCKNIRKFEDILLVHFNERQFPEVINQ